MTAARLSKTQGHALALLARAPFIRSVAGWHHACDSLNAFQTPTLTALEGRGFATFNRGVLWPKGWRITRKGKQFAESAAGRAS